MSDETFDEVAPVDIYPGTLWVESEPHRAIVLSIEQKEVGRFTSVDALEAFLKSRNMHDMAYYTEFADGKETMEFLSKYVGSAA